MPSFSSSSLRKLNTAHILLQHLFKEVVKEFDCTIVEGHRNQATQDKYYNEGKSKLQYPNGKHNSVPSMAVDAAPYIAGKGISWDKSQCYFFAGFVMGTAKRLGINIRWGGDWDGDLDINDQSFDDLVHFELI